MKYGLWLLAACLLCTAASASVKLAPEGIEIDGGAMGKLTFLYPKFTPPDGKSVSPEVKLSGDGRAEITYLAEGTPVLVLAREGDAVTGTMATKSAGKFRWEMRIPITFAGTGFFAFGENGGKKPFPKTLPEKPHLAQLNSNAFSLFDGNSDCSISIRIDPGAYWQLQDNRAWKWKIFELSLLQDVYADRREQKLSFQFGAEQPKVAKVRVDRFGQPAELDFPGKIRSEQELKDDVAADRAYYDSLTPPALSPWGGMPGSREKFGLEATGFFRTGKAAGRDVLVTPEGDVFFQLGVCTITPCDDYTYIKGREQIYAWLPKYESEYKSAFRGHWATDFSFYLANRIRKTGKPFELEEWKSEQIDRLHKWGFNSDGAFTSRAEVNREKKFGRVPGLYKPKGLIGDLCDPFDPAIREDMDRNFSKLAADKDDPTVIGYFIANEQPYPDVARLVPGFDGKVAAKRELVGMLEKKYGSIDRFNAAWGLDAAGFDVLNDLPLPVRTREAWADMEAYAAHFFDAYFKLVGETFRKYDPNHLLLGARFLVANANVESAVAACGKYCDVFSYNYYSRTIDPALLDRIHRLAGKPLLLSEWSFGTAEQGLAGGVVDVRNQVERGNAYRSYVEEAASLPYVIGSQWFSYVDQALTGRFFQHYNGECMNIGLVNVADRPFKEFLAEAMKTNYRIYDVMFGKVKPFVWRPEGAVGERAAKSVQIPHAVSGHKVDGVREPWPGRPSERIDGSCLVSGADDGGVGADFWLCWDRENLYLFAEVRDSTPARNSRKGKDLWQSDCIELFVGSEELGKGGPLLFSDRQVLISAGRPEGGIWIVNRPEQPAGARVVVTPNANGYALEAAIPWNALGITPESGRKFRFDIGLDDGDDGPRRLRQFMWSGKAGNSAERTAWGSATLVD